MGVGEEQEGRLDTENHPHQQLAAKHHLPGTDPHFQDYPGQQESPQGLCEDDGEGVPQGQVLDTGEGEQYPQSHTQTLQAH